MTKRLHVLIHGKVQGVNFRWVTYEKALQLGLTGWVRNTPNGKVEAVFEGKEEDLKEMLEFVKQGPRPARVRAVEDEWTEATRQFLEFTIGY